ncbi:hypothetical protein POJ06DRAFT_243853 [Lipomyces tetrasporus]|uniref:C3H1-type domain-containing protein n=1 Tax=Lipomyces tetrasporus TaxID=54092 RepID=A0AAD7QZ62_9ASCO|nr:uncharacterized protein POJ06DRAFT_243853 [Lipomyces tetrasporus]KAJ8104187.1 hypothetical protein POJ06DRAFT_243853 [Lipomyces tetrasporus]
MDASLQAQCDAILSDPSVLEEEQIDQISVIIQRFYASQGRVLASSDLDALVLDVLWRHRDGGAATSVVRSSSANSSISTGSSTGQKPPLEPSKKSIMSSILQNGHTSLHKKKVVRGKFAVPMPIGRPSARMYANANTSGASVGSGHHGEFSSLPSTRSASPDSVYSSNATAGIGSAAPTSSFHLPATANPISSPEAFEAPDYYATVDSPDLETELSNYSPFQVDHSLYDDDDETYRLLTVQQQQQQQQPRAGIFTSPQLPHSFQYSGGLQFEPTFDISAYSYDGDATQAQTSSLAPGGASTSSSPSTSTSSFSNVVAAAATSTASTTTQTPTASTTPTISTATPTSTLPLVDSTSSPFDHIRAALAIPAAAKLTDAEITAALDRNGYDILITLTELLDKLMGRTPQQPQQPVKVQTIGPAYSVQTTHASAGGSKEHPKIPTVCRYFLTTGQCLRPDCRFTHDLSATVCRYWLQNSCLAGSTCVFLHSIPQELLTRLFESGKGRGAAAILPGMNGMSGGALGGGTKKNITLKDESEFPSLPVSSSSVTDVPPPKKSATGVRKLVATGSTSASNGGSGSRTPGRGGGGTPPLSIKSMDDFPSLASTAVSPQPTPTKSRSTRTKTKVRVGSSGSSTVAAKTGTGRWSAG